MCVYYFIPPLYTCAEGWAGTHRLAVMWTGDNSGSMNYVRWQIPSFIGAGFSAQVRPAAVCVRMLIRD